MDLLFWGSQFLIDCGLLLWILMLRRELQGLRSQQDRTPSSKSEDGHLSDDELQALRGSLAVLVEEIESFTQEHRQEMNERLGQVNTIFKRFEEAMDKAKQQQAQSAAQKHESQSGSAETTRVLRIAPGGKTIQHPHAEMIQRLHAEGRSVDEIARELRLGKGEVQLVLSLS